MVLEVVGKILNFVATFGPAPLGLAYARLRLSGRKGAQEETMRATRKTKNVLASIVSGKWRERNGKSEK